MKNLLIRTLSSAAYVAVIAGGLLLNKFAFLAMLVLFMLAMMHEFHKMTMGDRFPAQRWLAFCTALALLLAFFCVKAFDQVGPEVMALAFIPLFMLLASILFIRDRSELDKVSGVFTGILYIGVPMMMFILIPFKDGEFNGLVLLCCFAVIWMSDAGAYMFGMLLGQKYGPKLCPTISPHKSWIGVLGGYAASVGTGIALGALGLLPYTLVQCFILSSILCITGIFGDLIESVWKRHYGLKDSGNLIPGHGGMLDRFDSSLMAIPCAAIYLTLL